MESKTKWILAGVLILGGSAAWLYSQNKKVAAAVVTEPTTNTPVTPDEIVATTNTPAVITTIPSTSFIGVTPAGNTINTNTTPVSTTYSKYSIGETLASAHNAGVIYTITAIQAGFYVMDYAGGGPLTVQVSIVDSDSAWSQYASTNPVSTPPLMDAYVQPSQPVYVAQPAGPLPDGITQEIATALLLDPTTADQVVAAPNNPGNTIFNFVPGPGFNKKL
jgi:hypothetical protein